MWYLFWIFIYLPIASWWGTGLARKISDALGREMRIHRYKEESRMKEIRNVDL